MEQEELKLTTIKLTKEARAKVSGYCKRKGYLRYIFLSEFLIKSIEDLENIEFKEKIERQEQFNKNEIED